MNSNVLLFLTDYSPSILHSPASILLIPPYLRFEIPPCHAMPPSETSVDLRFEITP